MREIRRKEKAITDRNGMLSILKRTQYITMAMSIHDEPYLVTVSHGYDESADCIYFHCAHEGKKVDILRENNMVWGQALMDFGYIKGKCDHRYATTQFRGRVTFVTSVKEKEYALTVMTRQLEDEPEQALKEQIGTGSLDRVNIGRIDIEYMSGKKSKDVSLLEE